MLELTMTRSELRAYDAERLAALLSLARSVFRGPEQRAKLAKAMTLGVEWVRDALRQLIWSVLAVQAEQERSARQRRPIDARTRRMIEGLVPTETAEDKRSRGQLRVTLLNAAGRSKRQRQTMRVPR